MKTTIFYFSGTGNSLKIAKDLMQELGDTELVPIQKVINKEIDLTADNIGLVFPVYMWGMPLMAANFVKKLKADKNKYFFAVTNYGGMPAGTICQTADLLSANGIKLSAGFTVKMPGNYTPMYGAISENKQQKIFEKEKIKIKEIAEIVKNRAESKLEKNFFLINWLFSGLIYKFSAPHINSMDNKFYADEKCTSCGICERVCPAQNIKIVNGKPQWQHKCEQCLACLQWCPVSAVQYTQKTVNRKRYHHPEIKIEDFLDKTK